MPQRKDNQKRSRQGLDELLIQAFLVGATWQAAAAHAGCGETTVRRKLRNPDFQAKLSEARRAMVRRTIDRTSTFAFEALNTLRELHLHCIIPAVRLRAAESLLEASINLAAIDQIEERLQVLEARQGNKGMRLIS